VGKQALIA
jgi:hypothetical protein